MKFKITIIVEGNENLKRDLEKGFVEAGIQQDVFTSDQLLDFRFKEIIETGHVAKQT